MKYVKTFESFLNESKGIPDVLYHFSSPSAILSILEMDILYAKNLDYERKLSVSFTRDVNFWKKAISGFKPVRKGAYIAVDARKIEADKIPLSDFVFKGARNFDYAAEDEVRAYPQNNELPIEKYLIEVGLTKHAAKEEVFAKKLRDYCEKNGIKIVEV